VAEPIRVLLVDDHAVVREGLRAYLELQPSLAVVGEAGDGEGALAEAERLRPDVILMDLVMPRLDGVGAMRELRRRLPAVRVIVLTSFDDDERLLPAIRAGAAGYLFKNVEPAELARAIHAAHAGEAILDPAVAARLVREIAGAADAPAGRGVGEPAGRAVGEPAGRAVGEPAGPAAGHPAGPAAGDPAAAGRLTPREREVLLLIAGGLSNKRIARELGVAEKTVKTHVGHLLAKLGVSDRTQAALYAVRTGLARSES
jgi:DNA-binding NarL/FixJ family response regulator